MHRLVKSSRHKVRGQGSRRQNHFFDVPAEWRCRYNLRVFTAIVGGEFPLRRLSWLSAMVGEHLDLTDGDLPRHPAEESGSRRFVGVHFVCCDVYTRVYINRDRSAYEGNCPRCAKRVQLRIGPGGTDARFFKAG